MNSEAIFGALTSKILNASPSSSAAVNINQTFALVNLALTTFIK